MQAIPENDLSKEEIDRADRIAKHMNYQLTVRNRNYKPDKKAMLLAIAQHGCDFTKTYFDPMKGMNIVERVRAVDLVLPYGTGPRHMDDIERKTHVITMSVNKSAMLAKSGFFSKPCVPQDYVKPTSQIQQVEDELQGMNDYQPYGMDKPGCVLEQHRLLDLDGDGIAEPYIVWLDRTSREILRIQIRWEVDMNGEATEDKKPIEYFTKYGFLVNPDGVYDIGYGHLLAQLNIAVNKLIRQIIDAGTLANIGNMSGFVSDALGIEGGDIELDIGFFKKVPRSVQDIQKSIYQFNFPGPNPSAVQTMQFLESVSQRLGSNTDAVTGDVDKVLQPMTLANMLESSLQMPTSIMEQVSLAFEDEFAKLYRLNKKYVDGTEKFIDGNDIAYVTPEDYAAPTRIVPIFDPRLLTRQQKVAKSEQLWQFSMGNPILAQNQQAMTEVTKRVLRAMDTEDVDAILPEQPEPEHIDDQEVENMYFLLPPSQRPPFDVFPDQDHLEHIRRIDAFIAYMTRTKALEGIPEQESSDPVVDKVISGVTDEMKKVIYSDLIQHRTKHVAYLYGIKEGIVGRNQQGGAGGMAPTGGNPADIQALLSTVSAPQGMGNMPPGAVAAPTGPAGDAGLPPTVNVPVA